MKNLCKASLAVAIAAAAFSSHAQAQTVLTNSQNVVLNGLGSSAMFLQLGQTANSSYGFSAACVWSGNNTASAGNVVSATDTSVTPSAVDKGNAWVEWTPGTNGSCSNPASDAKIYAYLQTDSVVGNRCLFNGTHCTITYPTTNPVSVGSILGTANEVALPANVATALNAAPNFAGTDIRPEDAAFATLRAQGACGVAITDSNNGGATTPYLGLGYSNGSTIQGSTQGLGSSFNVVNFSLPSSFTVTPLGAVPVVVVVNSNDTAAKGALTQFSNITSQNLAKFLDGSYYAANEIGGTGTDPVYVFAREPLSGTYNTMEYSVPNTVDNTDFSITGNYTSQDVGYNQPASQRDCSGNTNFINTTTFTSSANPLAILSSTSGSARFRSIGTGNELKAVRTYADANSLANNLGYGFWSVANYAGYAGVSTAKYLTIDSVDPLGASGVIPTTTAQINAVSLSTVADGSYPIYSLLRLVSTNSSATSAVTTLATGVQNFVATNDYPTKRPDFVKLADITAVRSHFAPPSVTVGGNAIVLANGDTQFGSSHCTALPEAGGDVGGVVISLSTDDTYCSDNGVTTGITGERN
jgi:hypothetical protein